MADAFADILAPPPPPPRAGFADVLAAGFGAGPDRMGAYQQGLDTGSQYRLRSAQTENALANAERDRAERMQTEIVNDVYRKAQATPGYAGSISDMLVTGRNPQQYGLDPLSVQERGFRSTLGDPAADPMAAFAAGQGVQGRVLPRIEALGSGREIDLLTQQASTNPIGEAQIQNYQEKPVSSSTNIGAMSPEQFEAHLARLQEVEEAKAAGREGGKGAAAMALARPQAETSVRTATGAMDRTKRALTKLAKDPQLWQGVSLTQPIGRVPGTAGARVRAELSAIQAQLSMLAIQELRNTSKAGGAVGQVTEKEWPRLAAMFGALDENMSVGDFREAADSIVAELDRVAADMNGAFVRQYDSAAAPAAPAAGSPAPVAGGAVTLDEYLRSKGF